MNADIGSQGPTRCSASPAALRSVRAGVQFESPQGFDDLVQGAAGFQSVGHLDEELAIVGGRGDQDGGHLHAHTSLLSGDSPQGDHRGSARSVILEVRPAGRGQTDQFLQGFLVRTADAPEHVNGGPRVCQREKASGVAASLADVIQEDRDGRAPRGPMRLMASQAR